MLISSVLSILDQRQLQSRPISARDRERARLDFKEDAFYRIAKPAPKGELQEPDASIGAPGITILTGSTLGGDAIRRGCAAFRRAIEDAANGPSKPGLDLFE